MNQPTPQTSSYSLLLIEFALTLVAVAAAFSLPRLGSTRLARVEAYFGRIARRKLRACVLVGLTLVILRLALLPWFPVPRPFLPDDFSFLLAADTFAHGRLANPTPAMWTHFESIHITMVPTYSSMYFPGMGLVLAAGKILFGSPWAALLLTSALMCGAICWMLQAWLPPGWALLGGFLAVLRIGMFSFWTNTYMGGGSLGALGGALVLGALPRLLRTGRARYGMLLGTGVAILSISRPFEGLLICLPVAVVLGHWALFGKNRLPFPVLLRRAAAPLALIAATLAWLGYYDYRAFGNAKTLPYTIDRATYAVVPYYVWQKANPTPVYRHAEMRQFYTELEARNYRSVHSWSGVAPYYLRKITIALMFFAAVALLPPLAMAWWVIRDRRVRFLVWCIPVWMAGMGLGIYLMPHYLAPFTAAFYALGLQAMRHMRVWRPGGAPVGRALVNAMVAVCVVMAGVRVLAVPLHFGPEREPVSAWISSWIGPGNFGTERAATEVQLERMPGKHLVFVRYGSDHDSVDEWVYNDADLDNSRVIWAHAMDAASDAELMRQFGGRDVWVVEPDVEGGKLSLYQSSDRAAELATIGH